MTRALCQSVHIRRPSTEGAAQDQGRNKVAFWNMPAGESVADLRKRVLVAAGFFLLAHVPYTLLQYLALGWVSLPPLVDVGVLADSVLANLALDLSALAFVLVNLAASRTKHDSWTTMYASTCALTSALIAGWGLQLHYGGSQSSHVLILILGTIVVVSWVLPRGTVVGISVLTTLYLATIVLSEWLGVLPYSPIIPATDLLRSQYLDGRIIWMNAVIYLCTFTLTIGLVLHLQRSLRQARLELATKNRELVQQNLDREQAQNTLRRAVEELTTVAEAQRRFLQAAAHDLRSPLQAIGGFASLIEGNLDGEGQDQTQRRLLRIQDSVRHMGCLLDDLGQLVLGEDQGVQPVPCDVDTVLDRVQGFFSVAIGDSQAHLEWGPMPTVMADEGRLTQVFQNLVGNALKFRSGAAPAIEIEASVQGSECTFSVHDNGIGVDPEQLERIFDPFERLVTRDQYEGNGIGLALCRMAVESMDGRIWAEARPGGGSSFRFTLPAAPGDSAPAILR